MLIVETIARIRREHLGKGVPIKQIARELRLSRNTVRKVVRSDETSFRYERRVQPLPKLGPRVATPRARRHPRLHIPRRYPEYRTALERALTSLNEGSARFAFDRRCRPDLRENDC